jgi:hypothetical protein
MPWPSWTRSVGSATRYRGGRIRLRRRQAALPEWPFILFLLVFVGGLVYVILASLFGW